MLGRALFALVWLVIAAGVLLPLYPSDLAAPRSAAVQPVPAAADSRMAACEDCPVPDAGSITCEPGCDCGRLLPATLVAIENGSGIRMILLIHPPAEASSQGQSLPKLPAI